MAPDPEVTLTARQRELLALVIEEYVATGQPVGSRHLVERGELRVSPSTVRTELSELEARGLLTHPHTSAGRVPTEQGYRLQADELLARQDPRPGSFPLDLSELRRE
ncbi:MAG: LexA family protein, partial [Gaiellaceae bacterium]